VFGRDVPDARGLALPRVRLQDGLLRVVTPSGARKAPPLSPEQWLDAAIARHTQSFSASEFLKAVRALSARYVEQRADLPSRSPLDSPGKRAAFAGFVAPLHYLTVRRVLAAIGAAHSPVERVLDLGCGTGVAAAAWQAETGGSSLLIGVDQAGWALDEAKWNWRMQGYRHTARRQSLLDAASFSGPRRHADALARTAIVLAWSVNEIAAADRATLLQCLFEAHTRGAKVLVLEPLARTAVPWWDDWAAHVEAKGGRVDTWKFAADLPDRLAQLDRAAGFRREHLSARSLWLPGA
jgi:SAM-dependent methyltransferase